MCGIFLKKVIGMKEENNLVQCFGCKAFFNKSDESMVRYGVGRYGVCIAECNNVFINELLGYEQLSFGYPDVHRLVVDAYAVQHPQNPEMQKQLGIEPRFIAASIQSVTVHLIALYCAIELKMPLKQISKVMGNILNTGVKFENNPLTPPAQLGDITIANFSSDFTFEQYQDFAWRWARCVWNAWKKDHQKIKILYEKYGK